jgi:hypothetical protein
MARLPIAAGEEAGCCLSLEKGHMKGAYRRQMANSRLRSQLHCGGREKRPRKPDFKKRAAQSEKRA